MIHAQLQQNVSIICMLPQLADSKRIAKDSSKFVHESLAAAARMAVASPQSATSTLFHHDMGALLVTGH